MDQNGTTGGGSAAPVTVTTTVDFNIMAGDATPRVIHVLGSLTGTFTIGSHKTIIGICGAVLQGEVRLPGSVNVIVRNLRIVGRNCTDVPGNCGAGSDAIGVTAGAHHLYFDHDDISDGSDGNLDINEASDFITVSWTKFHYSSARTDPVSGADGHRFSNLIGSADAAGTDSGHLNVTFHHNWWADNVNQRMPRVRFGKVHVFNNLFTATGANACTAAGYMSSVRVENNNYIGVNDPFFVQTTPADLYAVGNLLQAVTGNTTASGTGFAPGYTYNLEPTDTLEAAIRSQAGPR
jgi:pectate lyase